MDGSRWPRVFLSSRSKASRRPSTRCARSPGRRASSTWSRKSRRGADCSACPALLAPPSIGAKRSLGLKVHRRGVAAPGNADPKISPGSSFQKALTCRDSRTKSPTNRVPYELHAPQNSGLSHTARGVRSNQTRPDRRRCTSSLIRPTDGAGHGVSELQPRQLRAGANQTHPRQRWPGD